jgi:hypothetical protein
MNKSGDAISLSSRPICESRQWLWTSPTAYGCSRIYGGLHYRRKNENPCHLPGGSTKGAIYQRSVLRSFFWLEPRYFSLLQQSTNVDCWSKEIDTDHNDVPAEWSVYVARGSLWRCCCPRSVLSELQIRDSRQRTDRIENALKRWRLFTYLNGSDRVPIKTSRVESISPCT